MRIIFLLEEQSMKEVLDVLLLLSKHISVFSCKLL